MVHVVESATDFRTQLRDPKKLVVCYFGADWCGPCKVYGPHYESLAQIHGNEAHFLKCYDTVSEVISSEQIRAFPTTRFYVEGENKGEVRGGDVAGVKRRIEELKASLFVAFGGGGATLGGGSAAPEDARAARLRRFQIADTGKKSAMKQSAAGGAADGAMEVCGPDGCGPAAQQADDEAAQLEAALAMSMEPEPTEDDGTAAEAAMDVEASGAEGAEAEADTELTEGVGQQLVEMGFAPLRSRKALRSVGHGADLENCINWLTEHQDDDDIDDEATLPPKPEKPRELTPEERAEKMEMVQRRIAERRREREEAEKVAQVAREAERRKMGKETVMRREEMERMARLREAQKVRKEKEDARKERARILAELEKDKRERQSNNGKLNSRLGVDGYKPSGVQYDNLPADQAGADETKAAEGPAPAGRAAAAPVTRDAVPALVDQCISSLQQYRAGGDGAKPLDMLSKIIRKILESPEEPRFRRVNMDSGAYKKKIKPFMGGLRLLTTLGFVKKSEDGGQHLVLEEVDPELLTTAAEKLDAGLAAYQRK